MDGIVEAVHQSASHTLIKQAQQYIQLLAGRRFQLGEGWHSSENAVRFWHPQPRIPKETASRCSAFTTAYATMIARCNVC
jgi:hypothetical protein